MYFVFLAVTQGVAGRNPPIASRSAGWRTATIRVTRSAAMISWYAGVLVGVCVVTSSTTSVAAEPAANRVSLRWAAPDECPDDVRLVHEVERLLGQSLPDAGDQPLSLQVHVNVQGNPDRGYAAKISFASRQGDQDRYLEHPSCEQLLSATALVVALAIDPERVHAMQQQREQAMEPAAPAQQPDAVATPALVEPVVARAPRRDAPMRAAAEARDPFRGARLGWHGLAGAGSLPSVGVGFEAALGWHRGNFRAEVLGRYWLPREIQVPDSSATLQLGLATLGARACWLPLRGAWQIAACAGGDLGDLRGEGNGVENKSTRHALYPDVAAGFQVAYARSRLTPEAGFELSGAIERPDFGVHRNGQDDKVFQPELWAVSAFFGLAFEL